MKRIVISVSIGVIALAFFTATPALADGSPPPAPPGSSVSSGTIETNVQMYAERVIIDVGLNNSAEPSSYEAAHIDAYFYMLNQGTKPEAFDVWFPLKGLGDSDYYPEIANFKVWVNGRKVETNRVEGAGTVSEIPWATWRAEFPVGEITTISVSYDFIPNWAGGAYRRYEYMLETGAGWYGPIGDGVILARYPFEINDLNMAGYHSEGLTLSKTGSELKWTFTNLEPTPESNISFDALSPIQWGPVVAAQKMVADNPASVEAHLDLARALRETFAFEMRGGLDIGYGGRQLFDMAVAEYESAIALDPDNVDIYIEYLRLLRQDISLVNIDPLYSDVLDRALAVDPVNSQLLKMKSDLQLFYGTATANAPNLATQAAEFATSQSRLQATSIALQSTTATPLPTITLAPTLIPTRTPSASQTPLIELTAASEPTSLALPTSLPEPTGVPLPPALPEAPQVAPPLIFAGFLISLLIGIGVGLSFGRNRWPGSRSPDAGPKIDPLDKQV